MGITNDNEDDGVADDDEDDDDDDDDEDADADEWSAVSTLITSSLSCTSLLVNRSHSQARAIHPIITARLNGVYQLAGVSGVDATSGRSMMKEKRDERRS